MNQKIRNLTFLIFLVCAVSSANAGLISDYERRGSDNFVTNTATGQQWLRWTETRNLSIASALGSFGAAGWRVASSKDMSSLFSDFFPTTPWDANNASIQSSTGVYGDGSDIGFVFGELFGWTVYEDSVLVATGNPLSNVTGLNRTGALFVVDGNPDGKVYSSFVESEHQTFDIFRGTQSFAERAEIFGDSFDMDIQLRQFGVALVRDSEPVEVSEPATLSLLMIGLWVLGIRRNKQTL